MKTRTAIPFLFIIIASLACQSIVPPPTREGTAIAACAEIVQGVAQIQPHNPPQALMETGTKNGGEFDANEYFTILTGLSMQDGYALDYIYPVDFLGSYPVLYARPENQPPYASAANVPEGFQLADYHAHLDIDDREQGYFEAVVMDIMASQFYLVWHANYNDTQIVCGQEDANSIVADINSADFGMEMSLQQQAQVRAMTNIEPAVRLTDTSAIVEVIVFTKWGGFYRQTYTISRSFPHSVEMQEENLIEYDCGIMF